MDKTITKSMDDFPDLKSEVRFTGSHPGNDLLYPVIEALESTIIHLMDGKEFHFHREDEGWILSITGGYPEVPGIHADYQTKERFLGLDGSGHGLRDTLPETVEFEEKTRHQIQFYR